MEDTGFLREIGILVSKVEQMEKSINQINNKLDNVIVEGSFKACLRDNLEEMEKDGYYDRIYERCKQKHDTYSISRANGFMNLVRNISSVVVIVAPIIYIIVNSIN